MSIALAVSAERLVNVLHGIALRGQTGLLLVQHVGGEEPGQGQIFIEQGETIFARTFDRRGETALSHMMNWEKVSIAFHEGVVASPELRGRYSAKQRSTDTGPLLPIELQKTQLLPVIRKTSPALRQENVQKTPGREIPALRWKREAQHEPPAIAQQLSASPVSQSPERVDANSAFRVRALIAVQQVIAGLDRRERLVFLLLDGRRSMCEIAGLIHRSEMDIARILERFLALGLIERV